MPLVRNEQFAGEAGVDLTALGWARAIGFASPVLLAGNPSRAHGNANAVACYLAPEDAPSEDQNLRAVLRRMTNLGEAGWGLRGQVNGSGYRVRYRAAGNVWELVRDNVALSTVLDSVAQATTNGTPYTVMLAVRGTNPVEIAWQAPTGNSRNVTDASAQRISTNGKLYLRLAPGTGSQFISRGWHAQAARWSALPADPRPRRPKPPPGSRSASVLAITDPDRQQQNWKRYARLRELALAEWVPGPWQATVGGVTYTLEVIDGPREINDGARSGPVIYVQVSCTPEPTGFDPHQRHPAPKILVPDGTVREVAEPRFGDPVLLENEMDDPLAGFRARIVLLATGGLPE